MVGLISLVATKDLDGHAKWGRVKSVLRFLENRTSKDCLVFLTC